MGADRTVYIVKALGYSQHLIEAAHARAYRDNELHPGFGRPLDHRRQIGGQLLEVKMTMAVDDGNHAGVSAGPST